jgi:hypothetical protein
MSCCNATAPLTPDGVIPPAELLDQIEEEDGRRARDRVQRGEIHAECVAEDLAAACGHGL